MLKIETKFVPSTDQWMFVIRGMRNPKNSWDRIDSTITYNEPCSNERIVIGPNDMKLMKTLCNGGPVHAKWRRQLYAGFEIEAPLYWWKEFDTYRVGVAPNPTDIEVNSCSTMHKIQEKEFALDDFAHEHLFDNDTYDAVGLEELDSMFPKVYYGPDEGRYYTPKDILKDTIHTLNFYRDRYLALSSDINSKARNADELRGLEKLRKAFWWQMIQLLPSSYIQKRSVTMTYEALAGAYFWRQGHKQDEWRDQFCPHILTLPYAPDFIANKKANPLAE